MLPSAKEYIDPQVRTANNPLLMKANMASPVMYKTTASNQDTKNFTDVLDSLTKNFQTVYTTINGQSVAVQPVAEQPQQKEEPWLDSSTLLILGVVAAGVVSIWMLTR
jgi:hypothetical protein